jgi:hypothetical protein
LDAFDILIPPHRELGGFKNPKNGTWLKLGRALAGLDEGRMRSEIKAMLALAGLAAGCADRPAGAAEAQGKKIRPGVYELVTTMRPAPPPKTYTREELMRKFGFIR